MSRWLRAAMVIWCAAWLGHDLAVGADAFIVGLDAFGALLWASTLIWCD